MRDIRLLFGPFAAALLLIAMFGLALFVPGYDPVRQTVSEIGEVGSPMQLPFTVTLVAIGVCLLVFSWGAYREAEEADIGRRSAQLIGAMGISVAGVGIFSHPHDLHNVFGMSQLLGYQAPFAFALGWGADASRRAIGNFCWLAAIVVWICLALNLAMIAGPAVFPFLDPIYGILQRALFLSWFAWAAVFGAWLWRRSA